MKLLNKDADCAVVYIMGQSNAHAHAQPMNEEDIISEPMKNVHMLATEHNQSFDVTDVVWSGFSSYDGNLGETQNCTYSMASFLAKKWQAMIDGGAKLPDLYIVQISIGGQMIVGGEWDPDYDLPHVLTPGVAGICEIALYNFSMHILPVIHQNLTRNFKNPQAIGLHWIGSEGDCFPGSYTKPNFHEIYVNFFNNMIKATGFDCPLYLYKVVRIKHTIKNGHPLEGVEAINNEFEYLTKNMKDCYMVSAQDADFFDPSLDTDNIFSPDMSHYNRYTQEWFADHFLKEIAVK